MARFRTTIGTKLFAAFFAMGVLIAGLGTYGYSVLSAAEHIVSYTYDHPMMAINYARAASVDFVEMENALLQADRAPAALRQGYLRRIEDLSAVLHADLEVAAERSTAQDERVTIDAINRLLREWQALIRRTGLTPDHKAIDALNRNILDRLDMLVELNADHGFVSRHRSLTELHRYENAVAAVTLLALILACSITVVLSRRIVRPLAAAAHVAERIAAGELQTQIPRGGADETGSLLNSMRSMRNSIADQMQREQSRARSAENRLLDAVESSGEGIVLADGRGIVVVSNSGMTPLLPAQGADPVIGQPLDAMLAAIDEQCVPLLEPGSSLAEIVASATTEKVASAERQLPDGRWFRMTANPTRERGTILFFSDFTRIKAREERYRAAKQQAEAASEAKSRFLANMGHELRTPLNAIIGFSEMIAGQMFGPLGHPKYADYSTDILSSARNLLDIINSVLDLAQSESGKTDICKVPVELGEILSGCARTIQRQCEDAGLSFSRVQAQGEILVAGDETKLRQIFLNLLSNAAKFTDKGGSVALQVTTDGGSVIVDVKDSGIGMSADDIAVALTPFAQVDGRLARRYEGAGIGLPLAKAWVELHGGTLTIRSAPNQGTEVRVVLPLAVAATRANLAMSA